MNLKARPVFSMQSGVMMSEESQDKKRLTIPEKMFHAQKRDSEAPGTGRSMYFCGEDVQTRS